jgi:NAD(P)-dependent dehydrogenase (short-subunit alcohol dehydrogenase family)
MGTNCLGPFTFNDLLLPLLKQTAANAPKDSVRVVWLSSIIAHSVVRGGFVFDDRTGAPAVLKDPMENYMQSKVGNVFFASEMARRMGKDGILSLVGLPLPSHVAVLALMHDRALTRVL